MCAGHYVREASHSTDALAKAKDFDLVFTEVTFPGLGGDEYIDALLKATKAKIVVVTAQDYERKGITVIRKPFYKRQIVNEI